MEKPATTDHPISNTLRKRYSPRAFDDRPVSDKDLLSLFEAARWAPSSFNEQPWAFMVAKREDREDFVKILKCLAEPNQEWAQFASVLVLTAIRTKFAKRDKENRVALHDLGSAAACLTFEATERGLAVHQMAGVKLDKMRGEFAVPGGWEPQTAIAIGYAGVPGSLPDPLKEKEIAPRTRKPLSEFVFGANFGTPSNML